MLMGCDGEEKWPLLVKLILPFGQGKPGKDACG